VAGHEGRGLRALKDIDLDTFIIVLSASMRPAPERESGGRVAAAGARAAARARASRHAGGQTRVVAAHRAMAACPRSRKTRRHAERLLASGDVIVRAPRLGAGRVEAGGRRGGAHRRVQGRAADDLYQARAAAIAALAKYGAAAAAPR